MMVALGMAALLLWAGLEKAASPASAASTLRQLGVSDLMSRRCVRMLVGSEIAIANALLFRPESIWTAAAVVGLAGAFGAVGVAALLRGGLIPCSCLGPIGRGKLGWNQIAAFPVWVAGAVVVWLGVGGIPVRIEESTLALAWVGITLASLRAFPLVRAWKAAHADRRSAQEMLTWLSR